MFMGTNFKTWIVIIVAFGIGYYFGFDSGIGNQKLVYGDTSGSPKNCRALISDNIAGYYNKQYTADEAIGSIDRNCGVVGYIWGER